mmetsp:Transcript_122742/g.352591  ORF Transcript_122742/g.352591 Transcript_122742/m.352591 type:complete len:129 (+) Transcript_122742:88-474(+)
MKYYLICLLTAHKSIVLLLGKKKCIQPKMNRKMIMTHVTKISTSPLMMKLGNLFKKMFSGKVRAHTRCSSQCLTPCQILQQMQNHSICSQILSDKGKQHYWHTMLSGGIVGGRSSNNTHRKTMEMMLH